MRVRTQELLKSFQSTLPMKGVTLAKRERDRLRVFQSTLPMKGVTLDIKPVFTVGVVSIHTPNEGSDMMDISTCWGKGSFNPHSQ